MTVAPTASQIIVSMPVAILVTGPDQIISLANPASEMLIGTGVKHIAGRTLSDIIAFEDPRLQQLLSQRDADFSVRRTLIQLNGGPLRLYDFSIAPMQHDRSWRIVMLTLLSAGGNSENQEEYINDGPDVRAPDILSHEIKNPLAAINGAAQLLERSINDSQKVMTTLIIREVARIAKILDRMQDLSTRKPAQVEACNVHALIDQVRRSIETARDQKIKFQVHYDPSLPDVLVDPGAMMQILTNLLVNAIDAVKDVKAPQLVISTRYSLGVSFSAPGQNEMVRLPVEISISDNGAGVPSGLENEIFAPFVTTKREGQGLGLALVRKLLRDVNGRIRYERDSARGLTNFKILLPVASLDKKG